MSAELTFKLNGQTVPAPVEWQDIQIQANFINSTPEGVTQSVQPNITIDRFEFVNEAAKQIRDYITAGANLTGPGIFEGLPFEIIANNGSVEVVFDGVLDLTDEYREIHTAKVQCKIKKINGLNTFDERSEGISYGYLNEIGFVPDSLFEDLSYVVERKSEPLKIFLASVTLFLMIKELIEAIKDLAEAIANVIATATGGVTGSVASVVQSLALALIQAAYTTAITIAVIKLIDDLLETLISPVRFHKVIKLKTLLEKGAEFLGFDFETGISELDFLIYLPSTPGEDEPIEKGIPRPNDFGYTISEAFDLAKRLFNAKIAILDNTVILRSLNDPFWEQTSTYRMPSLDLELKRFNTDEFAANRLIQFQTDPVDWWTLNEFKGTNYEVITTAINVNNNRNTLVKGLDLVSIPNALGARKDGLNAVEEAVREVAEAADALLNFFGGNSTLASKVTARIGMLKISENVHTVPKLIYLLNGKIPFNHRDLFFGAKVLYDKYHNEKSFVENNFGNQYELYTDIKVPFGFSNFLEIITSNVFTTWDNRQGKVDSFRWNMSRDFANMDFRIHSIYTKNLEETFVEPE